MRNLKDWRTGVFLGMVLVNLSARGETSFLSPVADYFENWFARVDQTRAEQPHWAPPVFTTSPVLQEVMRYDISVVSQAGGRTLENYGSGKGLEFIPSEHVQLIVGLPPWQELNSKPHKNGWGDQYFLMKYRFFSANEENGNYVVTGFMGLTVPNGSANFTTHHFVLTPTIAGGKGWGNFDLQGTASVAAPDNDSGRSTLGTPLAVNAVAQYRWEKVFWPELELNYTYYPNGTHEGLNQLCVTPGVVLGKFPIYKRLGVMVGAACQVAVTDHPLIHRNVEFTARLPF